MKQSGQGADLHDPPRGRFGRWAGAIAVVVVVGLAAVGTAVVIVAPHLTRTDLVALSRGLGVAALGVSALVALGWLHLARRHRTPVALDDALSELAEAHAELERR